MNIKCFFGIHLLDKDLAPVNGVWWAFCSRCGARYAGSYDMATGETIWKPQ